MRTEEEVLFQALSMDEELDMLHEGRRVAGVFDPEKAEFLRIYRNALTWCLGWERKRDGDSRTFLEEFELEAEARRMNEGRS